jgi:hypothetical protein
MAFESPISQMDECTKRRLEINVLKVTDAVGEDLVRCAFGRKRKLLKSHSNNGKWLCSKLAFGKNYDSEAGEMSRFFCLCVREERLGRVIYGEASLVGGSRWKSLKESKGPMCHTQKRIGIRAWFGNCLPGGGHESSRTSKITKDLGHAVLDLTSNRLLTCSPYAIYSRLS